MDAALAHITPYTTTLQDHIDSMINTGTYCDKEDQNDAFFIADMDDMATKQEIWARELPRVEPFYAVKCNFDGPLLAFLSHYISGFDCASQGEMKRVLSLGVDPSRIIYANPCKQPSHIQYAKHHGVQMMTFDNDDELIKIKSIYPDAKLVLRTYVPVVHESLIDFGLKFGSHVKPVPRMLRLAKELGLEVIGVSFHVGSGVSDPDSFNLALTVARKTFDIAAKEDGFKFRLLDIGGGFPGNSYETPTFEEVCKILRPGLEKHFPVSEFPDLRIIAEPGRYYVDSGYSLATSVIARRVIWKDDLDDQNTQQSRTGTNPSYLYYLNEGFFGSFFDVQLFQYSAAPMLLHKDKFAASRQLTCSLWGPCLTAEDCIVKECKLPELRIGDWLVFADMGAYSLTFCSGFNSFPIPKTYQAVSDKLWKSFCEKIGKTPEYFEELRKKSREHETINDISAERKENQLIHVSLPL